MDENDEVSNCKTLKHTLKSAASEDLTTTKIIEYASMALGLTLFGGLMSGLTVGLASIDRLALEIDSKADP